MGVSLAGSAVALSVFAPCYAPLAAQDRTAEAGARVRVDTAIVGGQLSYEYVEGTDPWIMLSGYRSIVPSWGVAVGRLTVGHRFGSAGVQGVAEAYPRAGRIGYLYLAAAGSPNDEVFVPFRAALEWFASPTGPVELSAGARLFRVSTGSIVAYTGSVGAYRGNYWGSFRTYLVRHEREFSTTGQLWMRRYWAGAHDYLGLYLSGTRGVNPTVTDPARFERDARLTSYSALVERLRPLRNGPMRFGYGIGFESEEFAAGSRRVHVSLAMRLERLLQ